MASSTTTHGYFIEIGTWSAWFPNSWLKHLLALRNTRPSNIEEQLKQQLAHCSAHADSLGLAVELGGAAVGKLAMGILKQRASAGDPAAKETLVSLLASPFGPDSQRIELLNWLNDNKLMTRGSAMPVFSLGRISDVQPLTFTLKPEPDDDNPYSPEVQEHYETMLECLGYRLLEPALKEARAIRQLAPEVPMSHANVAQILEAQDPHDEEIEALLRQALDLDQHYVFARAGLARVLSRRGEFDAAADMLKPVLSREEFHFSEWRTVLQAQAEMAKARGDIDALRVSEQSLRDLENLSQQYDD